MENQPKIQQCKKLDLILSELEQIKKYLNIIPDKFTTINHIETSISSYSKSAIQKIFNKVSNDTNIKINPHLLRSIFTDKCTIAGIHEKYIDAFCGRISDQVIRKHYSDYSPKKLRLEYNKVESHLTLTK